MQINLSKIKLLTFLQCHDILFKQIKVMHAFRLKGLKSPREWIVGYNWYENHPHFVLGLLVKLGSKRWLKEIFSWKG